MESMDKSKNFIHFNRTNLSAWSTESLTSSARERGEALDFKIRTVAELAGIAI